MQEVRIGFSENVIPKDSEVEIIKGVYDSDTHMVRVDTFIPKDNFVFIVKEDGLLCPLNVRRTEKVFELRDPGVIEVFNAPILKLKDWTVHLINTIPEGQLEENITFFIPRYNINEKRIILKACAMDDTNECYSRYYISSPLLIEKNKIKAENKSFRFSQANIDRKTVENILKAYLAHIGFVSFSKIIQKEVKNLKKQIDPKLHPQLDGLLYKAKERKENEKC